ncbi:hypothetical protein N7532_006621 [Penicillium argentinense]|uniref:Uncharacterized protein n=1 Tax=Penicillium argentinense TaxID=1131581 RepID=A0A9W9FG55_9EURO|nr:uncharacterized protein N7532_006621 [Penicillium argentinense]KAJ5099620.1 hypothetical protein N7532_006621 [Penicillium argentinense]
MESIPGTFIIKVDYQPVSVVKDGNEDKTHACLGPDPAVFTLVDGHLESGDWILGRSLVEDRSLLPKRVLWFNKQSTRTDMVHKVLAFPDGDSYRLEFLGAPLISHEGKLFADLMKDQPQDVQIIIQ